MSSEWSFITTDRNIQFCPECNNFLETFTMKSEIVCPCCDYAIEIKDYQYKPIIRENIIKKSARQKMREKQMQEEFNSTKEILMQLIEEECPKCGEEKVYYHTKQLRSADEGSTIFYNCPKCTFQWNQNN
eukprot:TRINITY_DN5018_c0_g1_i1.p1 TRINITY_DN5018_c0_g1~~TRINITY_DN5018_c0_g1_i1.p1  ORF type:complete len:130 (-),score=22.05 TRINITY_DN5018_c0_g1_i1:61-450(-)